VAPPSRPTSHAHEETALTELLDPEGAHIAALRRLADFTGRRVLELGCGDGRLTLGIARDAASVFAFDPDADAVERGADGISVAVRDRGVHFAAAELVPAALGAQAAWPGRKVVAVVGDGGFLMSGMELATAVQERLPVVVVLVNDGCLTLIKATQQHRYGGRFIGVDLHNPDFGLLARSFGVRYARADEGRFEAELGAALAADEPALIEVRPADARV